MAFCIINLTALAVVIWGLSYLYGKRIVDVLPVAVSGLVLLLYVLAYFDLLFLIVGISSVILCAFLPWIVVGNFQKRREFLAWGKNELMHPGFWVVLLVLVGVTLLVWDKKVSWWDDYNFWATDTKSLFYLGGFAGKYRNVSPEFGDYPPAVQLMKWYFAFFSPFKFREGLMFAGYYAMLFSYLAPLFRHFTWKNPLKVVFAAATLVLFPSVAEAFYCTGTCADLIMAAVYGAFLASCWEKTADAGGFALLKQSLYLGVLVLVKNVGFLWTAFALLFWILSRCLQNKKERRFPKEDKKRLAVLVAVPLITGGSWLVFCLSMHRIAKLTGAALKMAAGGIKLPVQTGQLLQSFCTAFVCWPLHRARTFALDLSPLMAFVLILFSFWLLGKKGCISAGQGRALILYSLGSGLVFYCINLVSHLTIFATETQYLDPFSMVSSIERYGAPFVIGSLYLIFGLVLERDNWKRDRTPWLILACFVWLCASHGQVWEGFVDDREAGNVALEERKEFTGNKAGIFLKKIDGLTKNRLAAEVEAQEKPEQRIGSGKGARVLYLRNASQAPQWVSNAYISYEASPVSVMYGSFWPDETDSAVIAAAMEESHAQWLYVDPFSTDIGALFAPYLPEGDAFVSGKLYRIGRREDGGIQLRIWK